MPTSSETSLTPAEQARLTRRPSDRAIITTLALTGLIAAFMQTLVTPIIPRLPNFLDTTTADATWVLTSTLLAAAISTPISGRLGDMYGKRRVVMVLLMLMAGGSIISALSNTLIPMIVGRVFQGVGLGVIALGISILRDVIHPKHLGGAVALVSATLGVGGAVGLPVAALIAQNFDYHYLFWLATGLAIVAIVLVGTIVPVSTLRAGGRFDLLGAIGFAIGLIGILLGISKGSEWGWTSPISLVLLIGGVAVLLAWGFVELRTADPLVDLRVAARRPVLLTNLASISVGFAFFITTAALPVLLEASTITGVGLGQTLIVSSLCLMPLGLVMFVMSPVAARLSNSRGATHQPHSRRPDHHRRLRHRRLAPQRGLARHPDIHHRRIRGGLRLCRDADPHHACGTSRRDGCREWAQLGDAHPGLHRGGDPRRAHHFVPPGDGRRRPNSHQRRIPHDFHDGQRCCACRRTRRPLHPPPLT